LGASEAGIAAVEELFGPLQLDLTDQAVQQGIAIHRVEVPGALDEGQRVFECVAALGVFLDSDGLGFGVLDLGEP
jgi:hypothetical protein